MTRFSATDAALEGFRITRRHPKAVAIWAGFVILMNLAMMAGMISIAGPSFTRLIQVSEQDPTMADPTAVMALMGPVFASYLVIIPIAFVFTTMLTTAIYRASSTNQSDKFGFLRLGADELRVFVSSFVTGLLICLAGAGVMLVVGMLAGLVIAGAAMGGGGEPDAGAILGVFVMMLLMYLAALAVVIALYAKLSFASPMTFAEKKIRIFESWGATKGRFWPLVGCYVLAVVLALLVALLGWVISFAVMMALGGSMASVMEPDMSTLAGYLSVSMLGYLIVNAIFSALTYPIMLSPAMSAYRQTQGLPSMDPTVDAG